MTRKRKRLGGREKVKATEPERERRTAKRMSGGPTEANKMFTSAHPCRVHMSMFPSPW